MKQLQYFTLVGSLLPEVPLSLRIRTTTLWMGPSPSAESMLIKITWAEVEATDRILAIEARFEGLL